MVDLSLRARRLGLDRIEVAGGQRRVASVHDAFDQAHDRMALVTFGNGARVAGPDAEQSRLRQVGVESDVPNSLPGRQHADGRRVCIAGGTSCGRSVRLAVGPARDRAVHRRRLEQRAGHLRCVGHARSRCERGTFPKSANDPDNQTWNQPHIDGLYDTQSGSAIAVVSLTPTSWDSTQTLSQVPLLPLATVAHAPSQPGIPTVVSVRRLAHRQRRAAERSARGLRNKDAATGGIRLTCGTSTMPPATCWRRLPTPFATTTATIRSGSTRSAWDISCRARRSSHPSSTLRAASRAAGGASVPKIILTFCASARLNVSLPIGEALLHVGEALLGVVPAAEELAPCSRCSCAAAGDCSSRNTSRAAPSDRGLRRSAGCRARSTCSREHRRLRAFGTLRMDDRALAEPVRLVARRLNLLVGHRLRTAFTDAGGGEDLHEVGAVVVDRLVE